MKLTPGVNFTIILRATSVKRAKKDSQIKQLFALFGPACLKAACQHVDEIDYCLIRSVAVALKDGVLLIFVDLFKYSIYLSLHFQ